MNYFTPELYLRFNSSDDEEADRADAEWETAILQYNRYLKEYRATMPPNVRILAEKCCFHDAMLLGWQTHEQGNGRKSDAHRLLTLGLQQGNEMIVLCYFLSASPKETRRRKNWPFGADQKHWLYDEVAVAERDFIHRILWSDGSELEIPCTDLIIDRFPSFIPVIR